jgi:hypothetical protein
LLHGVTVRERQGCILGANPVAQRISSRGIVVAIASRLPDMPAVSEFVDLMRLAARPKGPQLAVADHSENSAGFPRRHDGPVNGMAFREARAVPQYGRFLRMSRRHE